MHRLDGTERNHSRRDFHPRPSRFFGEDVAARRLEARQPSPAKNHIGEAKIGRRFQQIGRKEYPVEEELFRDVFGDAEEDVQNGRR